MSVPELKAELKRRNIKVYTLKQTLIKQLEKVIEDEQGNEIELVPQQSPVKTVKQRLNEEEIKTEPKTRLNEEILDSDKREYPDQEMGELEKTISQCTQELASIKKQINQIQEVATAARKQIDISQDTITAALAQIRELGGAAILKKQTLKNLKRKLEKKRKLGEISGGVQIDSDSKDKNQSCPICGSSINHQYATSIAPLKLNNPPIYVTHCGCFTGNPGHLLEEMGENAVQRKKFLKPLVAQLYKNCVASIVRKGNKGNPKVLLEFINSHFSPINNLDKWKEWLLLDENEWNDLNLLE